MERADAAYLVYRDATGAQILVELPAEGVGNLIVGRGSGCDVRIDWDGEVSRAHAELTRAGHDWAIEDNGFSRNGTFVNGGRVVGRRRLLDGDVIRVGQTPLAFRAPNATAAAGTVDAGALPTGADITPGQRRVLVALCRPFAEDGSFATPATNQQIADELYLSIDAVKSQIRALFDRLGVEDLPQNRKRARLVELAVQSGIISRGELEAGPG